MIRNVVHKYLRPRKKFPHVWCPGCGHGVILSALTGAIDSLGKTKNEVILVSGIGCSSRAPGYLDFSSIHGTHGRALAYATGVKFANPELTVIVITGDGDGLAIGGNHFIHACRRNINLTVLVFNNFIYGMTGGQYSPTMPVGEFAATAPYGNIERPFDVCHLAKSAGANFVARSTSFHAKRMEKYIKLGIEKEGLSVIDIVSPCPSVYGFYNKTGRGIDMMKKIKENSITIQKAKSLQNHEKKDKHIIGIFADEEYKEYTNIYAKLIEKAKKENEYEELL